MARTPEQESEYRQRVQKLADEAPRFDEQRRQELAALLRPAVAAWHERSRRI